MKDLKIICVQPDDSYYIWQVQLWLESLREINLSHKATVLVFIPITRPENQKWKEIIPLYPEVEWKFYKDTHDIRGEIGVYIPIIRPYTLWRYFTDSPEMKDKTIFYCDCDILFNKNFNIDRFLDDDVNYLSDTNGYINASYFDRKVAQVKSDKLEDYKKIDVLQEATSLVGINRKIAEANNLHSGGAQYLLKNIDANFWANVRRNTLLIRVYLRKINREYFESESKGFQSWASDMWGILWELWRREMETKVVPELKFSHATDSMEKVESYPIFHNAGVSSDIMHNIPYFYKGKYHRGNIDPTTDPHLEIVLNNEKSKKLGTWYYASKLKELSNKYNLSY